MLGAGIERGILRLMIYKTKDQDYNLLVLEFAYLPEF
jgi:hypothetical protein